MKILDFGAGYRAEHAQKLRALGLDVVAHDFGANYVPGLHDPLALDLRYDVVYASNVVNVHSTIHGIERTIAQIALATTGATGWAVVNYPQSPRKFETFKPCQVEKVLGAFFAEVDRLPGQSCPVWVCRGSCAGKAINHLMSTPDFTQAEIACANIRPVGAVGANALVPRLVVKLLGERVLA